MFNRKRSLSPIQNVRKIIVPNIFNKNYKTNSNSPQKDKLYSDFNNLMEKKYQVLYNKPKSPIKIKENQIKSPFKSSIILNKSLSSNSQLSEIEENNSNKDEIVLENDYKVEVIQRKSKQSEERRTSIKQTPLQSQEPASPRNQMQKFNVKFLHYLGQNNLRQIKEQDSENIINTYKSIEIDFPSKLPEQSLKQQKSRFNQQDTSDFRRSSNSSRSSVNNFRSRQMSQNNQKKKTNISNTRMEKESQLSNSSSSSDQLMSQLESMMSATEPTQRLNGKSHTIKQGFERKSYRHNTKTVKNRLTMKQEELSFLSQLTYHVTQGDFDEIEANNHLKNHHCLLNKQEQKLCETLENDKKPQEWLKICFQNKEQYDARAVFMEEGVYQWKKVKVLNYSDGKFLVQQIEGNKKNKLVTRLGLLFISESYQKLKQRLEAAMIRYEILQQTQKLQELFDNIPETKIGLFPENLKVNIIKKSGKKYLDESYLAPIYEDFKFLMKQIYLDSQPEEQFEKYNFSKQDFTLPKLEPMVDQKIQYESQKLIKKILPKQILWNKQIVKISLYVQQLFEKSKDNSLLSNNFLHQKQLNKKMYQQINQSLFSNLFDIEYELRSLIQENLLQFKLHFFDQILSQFEQCKIFKDPSLQIKTLKFTNMIRIRIQDFIKFNLLNNTLNDFFQYFNNIILKVQYQYKFVPSLDELKQYLSLYLLDLTEILQNISNFQVTIFPQLDLPKNYQIDQDYLDDITQNIKNKIKQENLDVLESFAQIKQAKHYLFNQISYKESVIMQILDYKVQTKYQEVLNENQCIYNQY